MDRCRSLIEIVPNLSEGRRTATIEAMVQVIAKTHRVFLLDRHVDVDHNRTVLTVVGSPEAVGEVAFQLARTAIRLIDMRLHQGGHPCVGALDVLPFIPIQGETMEHCVKLARSVGERIGKQLNLPVFLYEQAAKQSEHRNLADIRRGGLSGLAGRMETDRAWTPDCGPRHIHPTAGAMAVGARHFLIAFNINFSRTDLSLAEQIARRVRFSNGGLPYLKAIGLELPSRDMVQVSMNVTNFPVTSIQDAFNAVEKEAESFGVPIHSCEVVGLVPLAAVERLTPELRHLLNLKDHQILEWRIAEALEAPG